MEKQNIPNVSKPTTKKPSKAAALLVLILFAALVIFLLKLIFGSDSTIGKYTKEDLPSNFEYKIISDESNNNLEKNQLEVEINQKLTEGQIATLAEELYNSKDKQRRFYIGYIVKGYENGTIYWANSDFDPELKIEINCTTILEDAKMLVEAKKIEGNILGIFDDKGFTCSLHTVYENNSKVFVKTSFKDGQSMTEEMIKSNLSKGTKLINTEGGNQGEYYVLNNNILEFYNVKNEKFTEANKIE